MLYDDQGNFIDDLPSTEIRYIISYDGNASKFNDTPTQ